MTFTGPELCKLTAVEAVAKLKSKEVSPDELLSASLERIAQVEPHVNAMPTLCEARARTAISGLNKIAAASSQNAGWLSGLPVGIKDLSAVEGVRTTYGTKGMSDFVPEKSDPIVNILENNGAIVVGKTNTPEMGAGGNTFNEVFGRTRNPHNTAKNAGGSSGGAAVSLATGEVWLSHGSDLAGSLRTPACYCGIVGMRPSPGRAAGGPEQFAFTFEGVQGPMARNVLDCALFLDAMATFDPMIPLSQPTPVESFLDAAQRPMHNAKIAWAGNFGGFTQLESDVKQALEGALAVYDAAGGTVEEAYPDTPELDRTYRVLRAMLWGAGPGRAPMEIQKHFKATLAENIQYGLDLTLDDVYDSQINRTTIFYNTQAFLKDYDCIAMPVVGLKALNCEIEYPTEVDGVECGDYLDWLKYSFLSTTTGLPSIVVPAGHTDDGMPMGIQLVGPNKGEAKLLQIARAWELALNISSEPIDPVS